MTQITIDLPESLAQLPANERESIIRAGLFEAIRARRREIEGEILTAQRHIQQFENQYGISFERFETELLPTLDTPDAHEDYNDWFFWQTVLNLSPSYPSARSGATLCHPHVGCSPG